MIMPDYKLRAQLYESGYINQFKKLSFGSYYYNLHGYDEVANDVNEQYEMLWASDPDGFEEARKAANADYRRNTRLKNRIRKMINAGECVFLTLTFTDEVLNSTTTAQRRLYVTRYLKSQSSTYIANIDFGSVNDREHYHGIISGLADFSQWTFGNCDGKRVIESSNPLVLAKYINKLCYHAIKETTKRNAVIYSRRSRA